MGFKGIIDKDHHLDSTNLYKSKDDFKVGGLRLRANILQFVLIYMTECITRAIQWPSTELHNSTVIKKRETDIFREQYGRQANQWTKVNSNSTC